DVHGAGGDRDRAGGEGLQDQRCLAVDGAATDARGGEVNHLRRAGADAGPAVQVAGVQDQQRLPIAGVDVDPAGGASCHPGVPEPAGGQAGDRVGGDVAHVDASAAGGERGVGGRLNPVADQAGGR